MNRRTEDSRTDTIPVFKPLLEAEELDAAKQSLEMGWLGMGSFVQAFEQALAKVIGAPDRHVAAVSTGHAALHLGLMLAGVGPGDEVITPAFNNIADFQAIGAVGAEPVFCDIDEETLCIDVAQAESLVSPRTKAVIVMDYAGAVCDHDAAAGLARRHGLRIIHDAAHSLGSSYGGRRIGSFSDICMFSFDPVKTVTCIDGGALVVRRREELQAVHEMRLMGMGQPSEVMYRDQRAWTYDVRHLGFRYHMANLHAAIGVAQLSKMDRISSSRRRLARRYGERLAGVRDVITPRIEDGITPLLYTIRVPAGRRSGFRRHLRERGVDTGIHWQPGHRFTLFRDCRKGDLAVTDRIASEIVSLPLHSCMSEEIVDRVAATVAAFFGQT
ncbi:MAG: DegT/DnrJ/EryC1/StrS family aminotransferase [Planctomycetota bacterium]